MEKRYIPGEIFKVADVLWFIDEVASSKLDGRLALIEAGADEDILNEMGLALDFFKERCEEFSKNENSKKKESRTSEFFKLAMALAYSEWIARPEATQEEIDEMRKDFYIEIGRFH